jgi:hypothetical protein
MISWPCGHLPYMPCDLQSSRTSSLNDVSLKCGEFIFHFFSLNPFELPLSFVYFFNNKVEPFYYGRLTRQFAGLKSNLLNCPSIKGSVYAAIACFDKIALALRQAIFLWPSMRDVDELSKHMIRDGRRTRSCTSSAVNRCSGMDSAKKAQAFALLGSNRALRNILNLLPTKTLEHVLTRGNALPLECCVCVPRNLFGGIQEAGY